MGVVDYFVYLLLILCYSSPWPQAVCEYLLKKKKKKKKIKKSVIIIIIYLFAVRSTL